LFLPVDNFKLLNFVNFNDSGANPLNESVAFKKTKTFSKTFSTNLVSLSPNFSTKYKTLTSYFKNDNVYLDSASLGMKRQHNFLNNSAISNNYSTFFTLHSTTKWINFNFTSFSLKFLPQLSVKSLNFFNKNTLVTGTVDSLRISKFFQSNTKNYNSLQKFIYFPDLNQLLNDDSDKKKLRYPLYKINNLYDGYGRILNVNEFYKSLMTHDLLSLSTSFLEDTLSNVNKSYKFFSSFSSNQSILTSSKSFRSFINIHPSVSTFNHNLNLNVSASYLNFTDKMYTASNFFFYNLSYAQ